MFDDANLSAMLASHAQRRPRHPAIVDGERVILYRELDGLVGRTAGHLADLGAGEGDVVGLGLRDTADHLVVLYALARLGAVVLPLDWRWTAAEKSRVARYFGADLAVVESGDEVPDATAAPVDAAWHEAVARRPPIEAVSGGGERALALSLSSGTTGRPKGPMLSHAQMFARFVNQWVTLGFNQDDRYLSATPLYFGGGRSFTMGFLYSGATVIMYPAPYEPADLVAAVEQHRASVLLVVPTLLRRLLALPEAAAPLLGGLRLLMSTGAVLHADERAAVMARLTPRFINYYGSTEGGGISVLLPEHRGVAATSVGQPIFATEVEVVDEEDRPRPTGEIGRIRYRGPAVATGFHNDPEATAAVFRDGWFYPGDVGRLDADGLLYLAGRSKEVIIRGGINIYPAEVEHVLLMHAAVRDAAVVGAPTPEMGEEVAAFVVADSAGNETTLREHCRRHLAPYKVPRRILTVDALPKSPLGKVDKSALVARLVPE